MGVLVLQNENNWLDVAIGPGMAYTHTFTTAGSYPYHLANPPFSSGLVEVIEPDVIDLSESVLFIENRSGSATVQDNPSLELGEGEFEDFTIEMFFYVSDLNYDGGHW